MTLEERLADALHRADDFHPSPDLFARLERSIEEDREHRRRLTVVWLAIATGIGVALLYFRWVVSFQPDGATIAGWEIALFDTALLVVVLIVLGPNIRRFAESYVADIFRLIPSGGDSFLRVLDLAYYVLFSGLIIVDADAFGPWLREIPIAEALETSAQHVAFFAVAMGILHAVNISLMPVIGVVFNSISRLALRRQAGPAAPPESAAARVADRNARAFAIGLAVASVALAASLLVSPLIGLISGGL